jgi:protein-S-isoprenylcysteine O-methyltransferase Ste14
MRDILTIVAVILIVLWLIGYIGFGTAVGNFIHILLVLAVIAILIRIVQGRRIV